MTELTLQDFERLILRLATAESVFILDVSLAKARNERACGLYHSGGDDEASQAVMAAADATYDQEMAAARAGYGRTLDAITTARKEGWFS